jgi:hypothetical protein
MPDASTIKDWLVVTALVVLIGRELLRWRDTKRGLASNGNGRSGDKSPAYWEATIGKVVKDALIDYDRRIREPERVEAASERRQIQVKLNQLAMQFELSVQEKQRQLSEAIIEIKRQVKDD